MGERHKETTADIINSFKRSEDCTIKCRLCGVKVIDDAHDAMWQGFKPGLGTNRIAIDEHEKCDELAKIIEVDDYESKIDEFFSAAGHAERARAERILAWRRGARYV